MTIAQKIIEEFEEKYCDCYDDEDFGWMCVYKKQPQIEDVKDLIIRADAKARQDERKKLLDVVLDDVPFIHQKRLLKILK